LFSYSAGTSSIIFFYSSIIRRLGISAFVNLERNRGVKVMKDSVDEWFYIQVPNVKIARPENLTVGIGTGRGFGVRHGIQLDIIEITQET
jgi:hypothetical protein